MARVRVPERAQLLALVRRIRSALPPGPSHLRDLVVALEVRLEGASADEGQETG